MNVLVPILQVLSIFSFFLLDTNAAKSSDEGRPYEFGFTIDGQQHRYERKDANGIIQGEFGFITADGVYHVTAYATDENGGFRILSMRNVKISGPLDGLQAGAYTTKPLPTGSGVPHKGNPSPTKAPEIVRPTPETLQKLQNQAVQSQPIAEHTTNKKSIPNHQPNIVASTQKPYVFTTLPTIKPACAGCGYVTRPSTTKKPINAENVNKLGATQDFGNQGTFNNQGNVNNIGSAPPNIQPNQNLQNTNIQTPQAESGLTIHPSTGIQAFANVGNDQKVEIPNAIPNTQSQFANQLAITAQGQSQSFTNNPNMIQSNPYNIPNNQNTFASNANSFTNNQTPTSPNNQIENKPINNPSNVNTNQNNNNYFRNQHGQQNHVQNQPNANSFTNNQTPTSLNNQIENKPINSPSNLNTNQNNNNYFPNQREQQNLVQNQPNLIQTQQYPIQHQEKPILGPQSSIQSQQHPTQNQQIPANINPNQNKENIYQNNKNQNYPNQDQSYTNQNPPPNNNQIQSHQNLIQNNPGIPNNIENVQHNIETIQNIPNTFNTPTALNKPSHSILDDIEIVNNSIIVPNNPPIPIKDKFPGMVDGLPDGITPTDISDLLYKFNYTIGFHGHYERGLKNGTKIGGYFVNGRDGISRVVTYVADELGYRPKFKLINLGLDSELTPKEGTEKNFGLKSFEFVWYPLK